jgi:hypothetical protein
MRIAAAIVAATSEGRDHGDRGESAEITGQRLREAPA